MRRKQIARAVLAVVTVIAGAAAAGAAYPRALPTSDSAEPTAIALAPSCSRATIITCTLSVYPTRFSPDVPQRRP